MISLQIGPDFFTDFDDYSFIQNTDFSKYKVHDVMIWVQTF